jgi:hypothetical protein
MAKLGEAYVAVHADLKPFGKDLDRGLKVITDKFERTLDRRLGRKFGTEIGAGAREGLRESFVGLGADLDATIGATGARGRGRRAGREYTGGFGDGLHEIGPIRRGLAAVISALEDGFSALPTEIKAVVGAAVLAAIIPAGAFIGAAFAGAIITGLAVVGTALAYQFEEVEQRMGDFVTGLRTRFVGAAKVFIGPLDQAFDHFDYRLNLLDPTIRSIFDNAADYVQPLSEGLALLVDESLRGLDRGLENLDKQQMSEVLVRGFERLGEAVGYLFETVLSNPDVPRTLEDLLDTFAALVEVGADILDWSISAYAVFVDIADIIEVTVGWIGDLISVLDALTTAGTDMDRLSDAWDRLTGAEEEGVEVLRRGAGLMKFYRIEVEGTIKATEGEEKALKELNKQFKEQEKLVNDIIGSELDYREAVAETTAGLKEHGKSLEFTDKFGRENIENVQNQINKLKEYVAAQVLSGKMSREQAQAYYNTEIANLTALFGKRKETLTQLQSIFGWLITINSIPPVPDKLGPFRISLQQTNTLIAAVYQAALALSKVPAPKITRPSGRPYGFQAYAEGGMIDTPTMALMGENYRPELVLPVTNPQRSAQLLAQSPLAGMVSGSPSVAVYIGNEQLEGRMYRVATTVNRSTARTLSQVPRSI